MGSCSVCFEVFDSDEVLLPCLHCICRTCLNDYNTLAANEHICRVCDEPFDIAATVVLENTKSKQQQYCDECSGRSVYYCSSCNENYCFHVMQHQGSVNCIAGIEKAEEAQVNKCLCHLTKEVFAYCDVCEVTVCDECVTEQQHVNHTFLTFEEAIAKSNTKLGLEVANMVKHVVDINKALKELFELKLALSKRFVTISNEIDIFFEGLVKENQNTSFYEQLQSRRRALKEQASKEVKSSVKTIEIQEQTLQTVKHHILFVEQYWKTASTNENTVASTFRWFRLITARTATLDQIELALKPIVSDSVRFIFATTRDIASTNISELGRVFHRYARDWLSISQPLSILGTPGSGAGQFLYPIGIVQLQNGDIVVADYYNQRLQVFNYQGAFLRSIPIGHVVCYLALANDDQVWVSCRWSNLLLCISLQTDTVVRQIEMKRPLGITCLSNGAIIAMDECNTIRSFLPDGTPQWESKSDIYECHGITAINDDRFVICGAIFFCIFSATKGDLIEEVISKRIHKPNNTPNNIAIIPETDLIAMACEDYAAIARLDGSIVHEWGCQGVGPGRFGRSHWNSVAVLQDGRIAVTDFHNCRIQIF